ncbi:ATP-binding cassette domain-containing protein, partial [Alphaproteobacteria bacterium]|nr:ATP-binding cassette domain-containing protein [Alphaproteobacteria bacterium]MDB9825484.1 ATP-binding cassette domain-containing protein [Alphaproteobacteria bacterium]
MKTLRIIFYPFALIIVILIRILRPIVLIRYGCIVSTRIGHLSANVELYNLCQLENIDKPICRHIDILYPYGTIANKSLYKMICRKNFVLPFFLMNSVARINDQFEKIFYSKNIHEIGYGTDISSDPKLRSMIEYQMQPIEFTDNIFRIKFNNVDFKYDISNKFIFKNFNFSLNSNDFIGIIGKSGSGKSTFIDLVSGLLKPTNGQISFNDIDINNHSEIYQKKISYIHQKTPLISGTILDNICFGESLDNINFDLLWDSIKKSQLDDLIKNNENLNIEIGENGSKLSVGQLQRVGIARALYRNTNILILDEPTSSLDIETETKFMNSIYKMVGSKTIILVSHNLKIIKNCSRIYKVKNKSLILTE